MERPIFLGICRGALLHGDGVSQDFFGVSNILPLPYFPQCLTGTHLVFAIPKSLIAKSPRITVVDAKHRSRTAWSDLRLENRSGPSQAKLTGTSRHFTKSPDAETDQFVGRSVLMHHLTEYMLVPLPCPALWVYEPTLVEVRATIEDDETQIGGFDCAFVEPAAITDAELRAIKSRPGAITAAVIELACKKCHEKLRVHTTLEKSEHTQLPSRDFWLDEAPDKWTCKCASSDISLVYLKRGFHDLFRRSPRIVENLIADCTPLYQRGAICAIAAEYHELLQSDPLEQRVQDFLENNPILWNFLAPVWIKPKPPVLTKRAADFAILTRSKILYVVEIEKPRTKLAKADGGVHSELQVGLNQIRDWRVAIQDHRAAFLEDSLGLGSDDVDDIRFILIAGLASNTAPAHVLKLRRNPPSPAQLYFFDELASFLHATETSLEKL